MTDKLDTAINLIKNGDRRSGRKILIETLKTDPMNEAAWLWLAHIVEDDQQRRDCLNRVLKINPNNQSVHHALKLGQFDSLESNIDKAQPIHKKDQKDKQIAKQQEFPQSSSKGKLLSVGLIAIVLLLLLVLFIAGGYWIFQQQKTSVLQVDLTSPLLEHLINEQMFFETGSQLQVKLQSDLNNPQLAFDKEAYDNYTFWRNAETMRYRGFINTRLPDTIDNPDLVKFQDVEMIFEYRGPTNFEYPSELVNKYVWAKALVTNQSPIEYKITNYKIQDTVPKNICYICLTYTSQHCNKLANCNWINLK